MLIGVDATFLTVTLGAMRSSVFVLFTAAISIPNFVYSSPAFAQEKERSASVAAGERVRIWFGANYGRRCRTAGPPLFNLTAKPSLGEVTTELADYTVPGGDNCSGRS
jgi:hypothetical protein